MPGTRKLGRPTAHRNSMLRGMVTYLLENGTIETTVYRAKEVRSMTEKMITLGKKNTLASRRAALSYITKKEVVKKLFDQIAPEYADRKGGYTSVYKLGPRRGDGAEMAIIRLVGFEDKKNEKTEDKAAKTDKADKANKKAKAGKAADKAEKADKKEKKTEEAKSEEVKTEKADAAEAKTEEVKTEEVKTEETNTEEVKAD